MKHVFDFGSVGNLTRFDIGDKINTIGLVYVPESELDHLVRHIYCREVDIANLTTECRNKDKRVKELEDAVNAMAYTAQAAINQKDTIEDLVEVLSGIVNLADKVLPTIPNREVSDD